MRCSVHTGNGYRVYECARVLRRPTAMGAVITPFDRIGVLPQNATYLGNSENPVGQIVASSSSLGLKDFFLLVMAAVIARFIYEKWF